MAVHGLDWVAALAPLAGLARSNRDARLSREQRTEARFRHLLTPLPGLAGAARDGAHPEFGRRRDPARSRHRGYRVRGLWRSQGPHARLRPVAGGSGSSRMKRGGTSRYYGANATGPPVDAILFARPEGVP